MACKLELVISPLWLAIEWNRQIPRGIDAVDRILLFQKEVYNISKPYSPLKPLLF